MFGGLEGVFLRWRLEILSGWASVVGWEVSILFIVLPLSEQHPLNSSAMHQDGKSH